MFVAQAKDLKAKQRLRLNLCFQGASSSLGRVAGTKQICLSADLSSDGGKVIVTAVMLSTSLLFICILSMQTVTVSSK